MKNSGFVFKARCMAFLSKLNPYQIAVLKTMVDDKYRKLSSKGVYGLRGNGR